MSSSTLITTPLPRRPRLGLKHLFVGVALLALLVTGACGGQQSTAGSDQSGSGLAGKKVLIVPYWLDNFNTAWTNWITRDLEKDGVQTTVINANAVASRQLDVINTAVNTHQYDAIIWAPIDPATANNTIASIKEAGIPQIVFGVKLPDSMKVPQAVLEVQTALTEPGAAAAQYIKDNPELGDHPKVAFMEINPISTDCQLRRDSFINGLKSISPNTEMVFDGSAKASAEAATKMTDFVSRQVDFNVFSACGADLALGGVSALKSAGLAGATDKKPKDVYIVTQDATPAELEMLWNKDSAVMISSLLPPKSGAEPTAALTVKLLTKQVPIDSAETAPVAWTPITPDCAKYRPTLLDEFAGVQGFTIPDCSFTYQP